MTYYCSECSKECQPELCNAGIQSGCHEEAPVLTHNDDGDFRMMEDAPRSGEVTLLIRHANFAHDPSDRWEAEVRATWTDFNGGGWTWYGMSGVEMGWRPVLRPLTESEESELNEELWAELRAEETPSQRVQRRVLDGE